MNAPHRRSDAQDDLEGYRTCQWTMGSLERGNRESRCLLCWSSATRKGTEFPWIAKRAVRFIKLGHNRVTLRCDNEPAIEALARDIGQARQEGSQTVPERSPVEDSQFNGIIERTVGFVAGQARTLKAALEHRKGTRIPLDARIPCWLVEFAAYLLNRCDIGSDGKTLIHRTAWSKGQHTSSGIWRESFVRACQTTKRRKVGPRFYPGVFVGMLNSSSEAAIVEQGTAIKTRAANVRKMKMER